MTSPSPMSRQKLFLPGLSGLTQGPGFPNLSCLGLLSDRILGVDFTAAERPIRRSDEHQPIRRRQRHLLPVGQRTAPPCLLTVFAPREDASGRERAAPVRGSDAGPGRIPGPGAPHPIPDPRWRRRKLSGQTMPPRRRWQRKSLPFFVIRSCGSPIESGRARRRAQPRSCQSPC